jgi:enamine deaminase RidA (YjgF/YER057c/UK114 family)
MSQTELTSPAQLHPPFGYSHVASIAPGSRIVWLAGQVGIRPDGSMLPPDDWEGQTRQVMDNIAVALHSAGANWGDVFKLTLYLVDTAELATVRAVRDEFVDRNNPPTSTLIKVAGLAIPELLIEIEAVAAVAA